MSNRVGLFEYFARPVTGEDDQTTRLTESKETFDDDKGVASLSFPVAATTMETRGDRDTYDDNRSMHELDYPARWIAETTTITKVEGETYDDQGVHGLDVPRGR